MIRPSYPLLPSIPTGYGLEPRGRSWFSIIVPITRTNEVTNPSGELATVTGYTAGAGVLSAPATFQYAGARCFAYIPSAAVSDGFWYTLTTTLATRAIQCRFKGVAGIPYQLALTSTAPADLAVKTFTATGGWDLVVIYYTETSATTRRITFRKASSTSVATFYIDCVQSEVINAGETYSTYLDGDMHGLVPNQQPSPFYWTGTPHASTSVRTAQTRAGGMVVPLSKYGFLLTAMIGLGLAQPANMATDYARIDGAAADYTRKPSRQFTLVGRFQAASPHQLDRDRGALSALLDRDLASLDQPMQLRYERLGPDGTPVSDAALLPVKYETGLGGATDNHHAESAPLTFTQYLPSIQAEGSAGAQLTTSLSVTNANFVLYRSPAGVWSAIGTGAAGGTVQAVVQGLDGKFYIGGDFTSFNGLANTLGIVSYDPTSGTIAALGTGVGSGSVSGLAVAPNGAIIAIGGFLNMGGVAAADYVASWSGSAWSAVGTPAAITSSSTALVPAYGTDGKLYVPTGGNLTFRSWDGSAWATVGTAGGGATQAYGLLRAPNGTLTAWHNGTSISAVSTPAGVGSWNGTAWSAVGSNLLAVPLTMAYGANGLLYGGGAGPSMQVYNGTSWQTITGPSNGSVLSLWPSWDGAGIHVGGSFSVVNGVTYADGLATLQNQSFIPWDVDLPGSATVLVAKSFKDGSAIVGYTTNGTAVAAGTTTVTNPGTARAYPIVTMRGPSVNTIRIYQIVNTTTGRGIYLNYTINAGETARYVFQPDNLSFTSDFQGNLAGTILSGSNEADFFLAPGANTISFFASNATTITVTIEYQPAYARIDDLTR